MGKLPCTSRAVDDVRSRRVGLARLRITAVVEVDTHDWIIFGEDESDAIGLIPLGELEHRIELCPGVGIRRRRVGSRPGNHRNLCRLPVAFLLTPADPLITLDQRLRDRGLLDRIACSLSHCTHPSGANTNARLRAGAGPLLKARLSDDFSPTPLPLLLLVGFCRNPGTRTPTTARRDGITAEAETGWLCVVVAMVP